jgi:hypothetical protein
MGGVPQQVSIESGTGATRVRSEAIKELFAILRGEFGRPVSLPPAGPFHINSTISSPAPVRGAAQRRASRPRSGFSALRILILAAAALSDH